MEGQAGVWILTALLVAALIPAEAENTPSYVEFGAQLTLTPKPVSDPITNLEWKFQGNRVADWVEGKSELVIYDSFKDRATVNTTTGVLVISNMQKDDAGLYNLELNNKEQDGGYDVHVIRQVPQPKAIMKPVSCNQNSEWCLVSCDGDITGAEPVTYYFNKGDGEWTEGEQNINITNDETMKVVQTFSCRIKNPLGQKDSPSVDNKFYVRRDTGAIVGPVIGVLVVLALVGGVGGVLLYIKRRKTDNRNITTSGDGSAASSPQDNGGKPEEAPLNETKHGSLESP